MQYPKANKRKNNKDKTKQFTTYFRITLTSGLFSLFLVLPQVQTVLALTQCSNTWYVDPMTNTARTYQDYFATTWSLVDKSLGYAPTHPISYGSSTQIAPPEKSLYQYNTYGDARLTTVANATGNSMVADLLASVGENQPALLDIINHYDGKGFVSMATGQPISYSNWAPGHPIIDAPCGDLPGFPYVIVGTDGMWRSSCEGTAAGVYQFNNILDCATPYTETPPDTETPTTPPSTGPNACDTANYTGFTLIGNRTYAVSRTSATWEDAALLADSKGGRLAVIGDSTLNANIAQRLSPDFGVNQDNAPRAWIGLRDVSRSQLFCYDDATDCITSPQRFTWEGSEEIYRAWRSGEPNNYCTRAERQTHPQYGCYGEYWVAMGADGLWSDEGDHGVEPLKLKAITEWPYPLDCVTPVTPPMDSEPIQLPTELGLWCSNQAGDKMQICDKTVDGGDACPEDRVACNAEFEQPVCPPGTMLNTDLDACTAEPTVQCATGYTWDRAIDKCVRSADCSENGSLNTLLDRCEKLVQNDCPTGYTFDGTANICQKTVDCGQGASYVPERDRCEAPPVWRCSDPGYTYNSDIKKCEADPSCGTGRQYVPERDRCETTIAPDACPQGYVFSTTLAKCIAEVICPGGGSLNEISDKCEVAVAINCPNDWTYNSNIAKCEKKPACPLDGVYDALSNLCLAPNTGTDCSVSGYTFDATSGLCTATPSCVGGTYNAAYDRCETTPNMSCTDTTYSYMPATGLCEKTPVCNIGTYNANYDKCLKPYEPTCDTANGYTFNTIRNRCEKTPPDCPIGTQFNSVTNKCDGQIPPPTPATCPAGTTPNTNTGKCEYIATSSLEGGTIWDIPVYIGSYGYYTTTPSGTLFGYLARTNNSSCEGYYVQSTSVSFGKVATAWTTSSLNDVGCTSRASFNSSLSMTKSGRGGDTVCVNNGLRKYKTSASYKCTYYGETHFLSSKIQTTGGVTVYSCPKGGSLNGTTCQIDPTCVSGTLDGFTCYYSPAPTVNPLCPGGDFDFANDVCYASYATTCPQGTIFDPASNQCATPALCANGLLNINTDRCFQPASSGCPTGYVLSGNTCVAQVVCPSSGTLNGATDLCSLTPNYQCPSGYAYNGTTNNCYTAPLCGTGSLNYTTDMCQQAFSTSCPSGYSQSGSVCQSTPPCGAGGSYNTSQNLCDGGNDVCSTPLTFDSKTQTCFEPSSCGAGTLNINTDHCESLATPDCGTNSWDLSNNICYSSPTCDPGIYKTVNKRCEASVTRNCGSYSWIDQEGVCTQTPSCLQDALYPISPSYSTQLNICVSETQHTCVAKTSYAGLPSTLCQAVPVCNQGMYIPSTDSCSTGKSTCPLGDYACIQPVNSTTEAAPGVPMTYCSPNQCVSQMETIDEDTPSGENDIKADGTVDEAGNCSGSYYVFNGLDKRCVESDSRGVVVSVSKLVVQVALAASGVGAMASFLISAATQVLGDAALGQLGAGTLMSVGAAAVASGVMELSSIPGFKDTLDSLTKPFSDAYNSLMSAITTQDSIGGLSLMGDTLKTFAEQSDATLSSLQLRDMTSWEVMVRDMYQSLSAATGLETTTLNTAKDSVVAAGAGGLTGQFKEMKCCYPDKLNPGCKPEEIKIAEMARDGKCHKVGSYCAKKWFLLGCVVTKETSCCFSSMLAKIFQEQGRPQLLSFGENGGWGSPKSPNCRGFTPEEFQLLDFSKIDLSEYVEVVVTAQPEEVKSAIVHGASNYFQQLESLKVSTPGVSGTGN